MKNAIRSIGAGEPPQVARSALQQTEEHILSLETERARKLEEAEGDYLGEVDAIDQQLRSLRANIVVHNDRIAAMGTRRVKQAHARREREKVAAITDISNRLERRASAAQKLDEELARVADTFAELSAADQAVFAGWPDMLPQAHSLRYCSASIHEALSSIRKHRPMSAGLIRELVQHLPYGFASLVDERGRELIAELEAAKMPDLPMDEAAAA
jgi:hypothetical protein